MRHLVATLLCALCAAPLGAASSKLEPPDISDYLRWGPFRVRPGIELTDVGYDDNILNSAESEEQIGDYTATVSPKLEGVALLGSRSFLTYRGRLDRTFYLDNGDQDFTNYGGRARLTVPVRSIGIFVEGAARNDKQRPADLDDIRPEGRTRRLDAGLILEPGWRTEVEIARRFTRLAYFDPGFVDGSGRSISEILDRDEEGWVARLTYRVRGRTRLSLSGVQEKIEFVEPTSSGVPRDTDEWRLLVGAEFAEGGPLSGALEIGRVRIDSVASSQPDLSTVIGEAELVYRPTRALRVRLEAERAPGFSIFRNNTYFLETNYELRAVRYLSRAIGLEAGTSRSRLEFPGSSGEEREDRLRSYDVGVRLRVAADTLGRQVEYRLLLGRERRDSTLDRIDRSRRTVGINAVLGF